MRLAAALAEVAQREQAIADLQKKAPRPAAASQNAPQKCRQTQHSWRYHREPITTCEEPVSQRRLLTGCSSSYYRPPLRNLSSARGSAEK